jgi:hypothetical protein
MDTYQVRPTSDRLSQRAGDLQHAVAQEHDRSMTHGQLTYGHRSEGFFFVAAVEASAHPGSTDRKVEGLQRAFGVGDGAEDEQERERRDSRIEVAYVTNERGSFEESSTDEVRAGRGLEEEGAV